MYINMSGKSNEDSTDKAVKILRNFYAKKEIKQQKTYKIDSQF